MTADYQYCAVKHRIAALRKKLTERNIDGVFVTSQYNVTYLTGFTGDSSILVVSMNRCLLITDGRYIEQAGQECSSETEIIKWFDNKRYGIKTYQYAIKTLKLKRLGFEGQTLSFSEYEKLKDGLIDTELIDIQGIIENIRIIKDQFEIENIRIACEISVRALETIIPDIRTGMTENELAAQLEYSLRYSGANSLSFETIILSGARTSLLHGKPGNNKITYGDFILLDFGACFKGYHADISRTLIMGKACEKQQELYNIIKDAQKQAIAGITEGMTASKIDEIVRKTIPEKYIAYYYPGLGHGVGLQIHEEPFLRYNSESVLKKNMVLTVEPGIYIPGWGGLRIEDTVVVTNGQVENLTNFTKELLIL